MARPINGLEIHEGYTDLEVTYGVFEIDITDFEQPSALETPSFVPSGPPPSLGLLFRMKFTSEAQVPQDYKAVFTVSAVEAEPFEFTQYPDASGYVKLETPLLPIAMLTGDAEPQLARMEVTGPLTERAEECYLKVDSDPDMYTMIRDLCVHEGFLCVYGGNENYYRVLPELSIGSGISAFYITKTGELYGYNDGSHAWESLTDLTFWKIPNPAALEAEEDGFYKPGTGIGTPQSGHLGDGSGPFEDYSASLLNPQVYHVNIGVEVFRPGLVDPIFTDSFENMMPG